MKSRIPFHDLCREALTGALSRGEIMSVFQPILLATRECIGFEALSRFPNGCSPGAVGALAESLGRAAALDTVALTVALAAACRLPGKLFLNISASHFTHMQSLVQFGPPERLAWEVTESGLMTDAGLWGSRWLKNMGYHVAMDDAGTGYSTEERLRELRPDIVKLDLGVVQRWGEGVHDPLRRWVAAAHNIGALVLTEGVEDPAWLSALVSDGVHAVQGYAFGEPASATEWLGKLPLLWEGGKNHHFSQGY